MPNLYFIKNEYSFMDENNIVIIETMLVSNI